MKYPHAFISRDEWDSMANELPINCQVVVTTEDGTEYNSSFFMESVNPVEFKKKMDSCQEFLIRTLMYK